MLTLFLFKPIIMKLPQTFKQLFAIAAFALMIVSCESRNNKTEAEAAAEAKVGKVYDDEQQGQGQENRVNQFSYSRNDSKQGDGLETGAPSDTSAVKEPANK